MKGGGQRASSLSSVRPALSVSLDFSDRGIDFVAKLERINLGYNWSINVGVALLANLSAMWPALRPYWEASRIARLYPRLILMCSYLSGDGLSSFVFELHIVCCHTSCSSRTSKTKIFFVFSPNLI